MGERTACCRGPRRVPGAVVELDIATADPAGVGIAVTKRQRHVVTEGGRMQGLRPEGEQAPAQHQGANLRPRRRVRVEDTTGQNEGRRR